MSSNRRRHANAIPIAWFATWGVVALCALGGGLSYVWCKNQLYTTGTEIRGLERELTELKNKNEVALSKIAQLSSTAKLQERFNSGFINMVPIRNEHIAVIAGPVVKAAVGELRPISNERGSE
jgi:hypothetical protein